MEDLVYEVVGLDRNYPGPVVVLFYAQDMIEGRLVDMELPRYLRSDEPVPQLGDRFRVSITKVVPDGEDQG